MQTLGISNSEPRSESRLKSLFWPSIQNATDADDLGMQGYWICAIVAVFSFVLSIITGHLIAGFFVLVFYYLGGVGVREHNLYAALLVLLMFILEMVAAPGIPKLFICVVLFSNFRATWIASRWKADSPEAEMPMRLGGSWGEKFADQLPQWLWPKAKIIYFVFAPTFLALVLIGLIWMLTHPASPARYHRP
jgi:hypothetical protein